jgi:acyl carrier protein
MFQEVVNIISRYAKDTDALKSVSMGTSILKDLKVNSTRFVDVVLDFEDKFNIEISDEDADKIQTIGDAVTLLSRLAN